jgi:hypothetical protein
MTHFPPELGSQRYAEAVHEHKDTFEQQGVALDTVFTFVDKTRFPKETEMLATEFPDAKFHSAEYDSRDPMKKVRTTVSVSRYWIIAVNKLCLRY